MSALRASVLLPNFILKSKTIFHLKNRLIETISLAHALNLNVCYSEVINLRTPSAAVLFGTGKLTTLSQIFQSNAIKLVIIDYNLSPIQQRNLENSWKLKVIDRTGLILDIFANRANTREGILQVNLAALLYQKTRLVRSWTHLERQRGGLSFVAGSGERQLESDRRVINHAIVRLKRQLSKISKTQYLQRHTRKKKRSLIVALVGYTNAGKSSLFNRLTNTNVFVKDMVFATLDSTMRRLKLKTIDNVILLDTVGFISDLPVQLIAAFRSTLEEIIGVNLILHIRDIAHPQTQTQFKNVNEILDKIGVNEIMQENIIEVWNKSDLLTDEQRLAAENRAQRNKDIVLVSAKTGLGIDDLRTIIVTSLTDKLRYMILRLSFSDGKRRAWLFAQGVVNKETQIDSGYEINVTWTDQQRAIFSTL